MAHYFISYVSADLAWAEWIAWLLEEMGHHVTIQQWDFRPGGNFVAEMQTAAELADRTIAVLSPDYLSSSFATPEWAAAFAEDPTGLKRKLVPIKVRDTDLTGMWKGIVHIDVVGVDEDTAKCRLVEGLESGRAKPSMRPAFPGGGHTPDHKGAAFPGPTEKPTSKPERSFEPYVPKVRRPVSDLDRRRFAKEFFAEVSAYFRAAMDALRSTRPGIETDIVEESRSEFRAAIFVDGELRCRCRIWLGAMHDENSLGYFEGPEHSDSAVNEVLSVMVDDAGGMALKALMGGTLGQDFAGLKLDRLSVSGAAEFLWRRFVRPLER